MFVDKFGFNQIDELILKEKEKLKEAVQAKATAFQNDTNGWHDNAAYEVALQQEDGCYDEINRLINFKLKAKIVEKHNDLNKVDIGDTITLEMDEDDVFDVRLTGKFLANAKAGEITLNSPLGQTIYKKEIGDVAKFNSHGNNVCFVKILNIQKEAA